MDDHRLQYSRNKRLGAATGGGPSLTLERKRIVVTTDGENLDVGVVELVH